MMAVIVAKTATPTTLSIMATIVARARRVVRCRQSGRLFEGVCWVTSVVVVSLLIESW